MAAASSFVGDCRGILQEPCLLPERAGQLQVPVRVRPEGVVLGQGRPRVDALLVQAVGLGFALFVVTELLVVSLKLG